MPTTDAEYIERPAMLFEAGSYPNREIDVTEDDLDRIAAGTSEAPIQVGHKEPGFTLGSVRNLVRKGRELWGTLHLHPEANALVERNGMRSLSVAMTRTKDRLTEVSFTGTPVVSGAAMFSEDAVVFSVGDTPDVVEFKGSPAQVTWITVNGHAIPITGGKVEKGHVSEAAKTHGFSDAGKKTLEDAHDNERIRTDKQLYRVIDHASKATAKGQDEAGALEQGLKRHGAMVKETPEQLAARHERIMAKLPKINEAIPKVRAQVSADLMKDGFPKERVGAAVTAIMDATSMRVGSEVNANKEATGEAAWGGEDSFGASSLRKHHVSVDGDTVHFKFPGKSKKAWERSVTDQKLAKVVRELHALPGERLMQYQDGRGSLKPFTETHANEYLAPHGITPKNFRTYHANRIVSEHLHSLGPATSVKEAENNVTSAIEKASNFLGNTPAIVEKSYIHKAILDHYRTQAGGTVEMSETVKAPFNFGRHLAEVEQARKSGQIKPKDGSYIPPDMDKKPGYYDEEDEEDPDDCEPAADHKAKHERGGKLSSALFTVNPDTPNARPLPRAEKGMTMKAIFKSLIDKLRGTGAIDETEAVEFSAAIDAHDDATPGPTTAEFSRLQSELADLRTQKVTADAEAWADKELTAGRAVPAEVPAMVAAFCTAVADDARDGGAVTFSQDGAEVKASRVELLKRLYEGRQPSLLFSEVMKDGGAVELRNKMQTEQRGGDKPFTEERRQELLNLAGPLGRVILNDRKGN